MINDRGHHVWEWEKPLSGTFFTAIFSELEKKSKYISAVRSTEDDLLIKTQLCKLRVMLRSRLSRGVYTREGYRSVTPLLMPEGQQN